MRSLSSDVKMRSKKQRKEYRLSMRNTEVVVQAKGRDTNWCRKIWLLRESTG